MEGSAGKERSESKMGRGREGKEEEGKESGRRERWAEGREGVVSVGESKFGYKTPPETIHCIRILTPLAQCMHSTPIKIAPQMVHKNSPS